MSETIQLGKRAGFDDVAHCLGLTTGALIRVCKALSLSTGLTIPLTNTLDQYRNGSGETTVVVGG